MVNVDKAFEVRYQKGEEQFEVLVDFNTLQEFKKNPQNFSVYDVLADSKIFKDQKKGELASENLLNKIFENKTEEEILKEILIEGECQIPTTYINELREKKRNQVINYIAENAVNPATKGKYTTSMIQSAISKIKYNFDPYKGYEYQAEELLKDLRKQLPISMEKVIIKMEIPGEFCGAFYGPFRSYGHVTKEFYDDQGALHIHMEISESQIDKVASFIKNKTNGEGSYHVSKD